MPFGFGRRSYERINKPTGDLIVPRTIQYAYCAVRTQRADQDDLPKFAPPGGTLLPYKPALRIQVRR